MWRRLKRIFRNKQLIVVLDSREWTVAMPPEAELLARAQRGPMLFLSFDTSLVPGDKKIEFIHVGPEGGPGKAPEVLFDRTKAAA